MNSTKEIHNSFNNTDVIWQRSYYDHIIRNKENYDEVCKYVYENPLKWFYDELYSE